TGSVAIGVARVTVVAVIAAVVGRAGDRRARYRANAESDRRCVTAVASLARRCCRKCERTGQRCCGGVFEYRVHGGTPFRARFRAIRGPTLECAARFLGTEVWRSRSAAKSFTIIWSRLSGNL